MDIKRIIREIVVESIPIQDYLLGDLDNIIKEKTRQLDISYKRKAMERVVSQYYYNHFNKLILEDNIEEVLPLFLEIKKDINEREGTTNLMFVNVNPASNHSLLSFQQLIEKAVKKKWIKKYLYVLEQRGETVEDAGRGFHTHIIIEKDELKSYTQCVKEMARTFQKVCDTSNIHLFSVYKVKDADIEKRRNYILGRKADESKWAKQDIDVIWRNDNFLRAFYGDFSIGLQEGQ